MSDQKIMTLHPEGKQGVNLDNKRYVLIKQAILEVIHEHDEIAFKALAAAVAERLPKEFDGSVPWYVTTIKLDLEAREFIERVPGKTPQHLRLRKI